MTKYFAAAALAMFLAAPVFAQDPPAPTAKIVEIQGRVLSNLGDEFKQAFNNQALKPGDRVMAQDNSGASIVFDDGCEFKIVENTIVTIPVRSTNCSGTDMLVQQLNPAGPGAIGATGDYTASHFILGSVAALGIYLFFFEDDDDTVSP